MMATLVERQSRYVLLVNGFPTADSVRRSWQALARRIQTVADRRCGSR